MDTAQASLFHSDQKVSVFFRKRHTVTVAFAVGVLMFLLPFAEIKCNKVSLARNSGIGIAIGSEWRLSTYSSGSKFFSDSVFKNSKSPANSLSDGPNIFAIAALAAGLTGLLFCFSFSKSRSLICMSAGILAAVMLIALMIQLRYSMNSGLKDGGTKEDIKGIDMSSIISVSFTAWYYLSFLSFSIAAFLALKHNRIEMEDAIRNSFDFEFQQEEKNITQD